jgi:hypothetical protein
MLKQRYDLDGGLGAVRDMITRCAQNLKPVGSFTPAKMFQRQNLGGLLLDREEAIKFEQALSTLSPDEGQPRSISRATVNALIEEAILVALDIHQKQPGTNLEDRTRSAIQVLREKLQAPIVDWEVWRTVDRLKVPAEGYSLGKILFCDANHDAAQKAHATLIEILKSHPTPLPSSSLSDYWPDEFSKQTLCRISVKAGDDTAARQLADGELQTTISVLNFFASLVFPTDLLPVVCISKSLPSYSVVELALTESPKLYFSAYDSEHRSSLPFDLKKFDRDAPVKEALNKVCALLRDEGEIEFRDRLLTAVKWAGKGASTETRENSFLFYAIALETLLLGGKHHEQLAYKLRLRAAHLLGRNPDGRARTRDRVNHLYEMRSKMAHSGKMQVPEADLSLLRIITQSCIIHLLSADKFKDITTDKALEQWFENAVISGADESPPLGKIISAESGS